MRPMGWMAIGIALLWLAGCAPAEKMTPPAPAPAAPSNPPPAPAAAEKSTARQAVEGFTGKTTVDAGQRTINRVKAIEEKRRKDAEEMPPY